MADIRTATLTIANGQQTTGTAFAASDSAAFGLQWPATAPGPAITYPGSADRGATYQPLSETATVTDDGSATRATTLAVVQGRSYDLPVALVAWHSFKIVSGSAEGGARSLIVIGKRP